MFAFKFVQLALLALVSGLSAGEWPPETECPQIHPQIVDPDQILKMATGIFYSIERMHDHTGGESDLMCNRVRSKLIGDGHLQNRILGRFVSRSRSTDRIFSGNYTAVQVDPIRDPTLFREDIFMSTTPLPPIYFRLVAVGKNSDNVEWSAAYNCTLTADGSPLERLYVSSNVPRLPPPLIRELNLQLTQIGINTVDLDVIAQPEEGCPPVPEPF